MTTSSHTRHVIFFLLLATSAFGQDLLECTGPSRRKAWRYMSCSERETYLDAVKILNTNPPAGVPSYGAFVHLHWRNRRPSHGNDVFLPWHRWYIYQFERALQIAANDCSIGLPYWDWELDAENESASNVFESNTFGSPTGTAIVNGNRCASEGIASHTNNWVNWVDTPCVQREFDGNFGFVDEEFIADIILESDTYAEFRPQWEGTPHAMPHLYVAGNMETMWAPNDPLFFLHHCNVDRFWTIWQDYHDHDEILAANLGTNHYSSNLDRPLPFQGISQESFFYAPGTNRFPTPREIHHSSLSSDMSALIDVVYVDDVFAAAFASSEVSSYGSSNNPDWVEIAPTVPATVSSCTFGVTSQPTSEPTSEPTTVQPTTSQPTTSQPTTAQPATAQPTTAPTTAQPTVLPTTDEPTASPTTGTPTSTPSTRSPTAAPTTVHPTAAPTTRSPTSAPTTRSPTSAPTTLEPTAAPTTHEPTPLPETRSPTAAPSTSLPTVTPTTNVPTAHPTDKDNSGDSTDSDNSDDSTDSDDEPTTSPTTTVPTSAPSKDSSIFVLTTNAPTASPTTSAHTTAAPAASPRQKPRTGPTPCPTSEKKTPEPVCVPNRGKCSSAADCCGTHCWAGMCFGFSRRLQRGNGLFRRQGNVRRKRQENNRQKRQDNNRRKRQENVRRKRQRGRLEPNFVNKRLNSRWHEIVEENPDYSPRQIARILRNERCQNRGDKLNVPEWWIQNNNMEDHQEAFGCNRSNIFMRGRKAPAPRLRNSWR